jgi:hypothetical protein
MGSGKCRRETEDTMSERLILYVLVTSIVVGLIAGGLSAMAGMGIWSLIIGLAPPAIAAEVIGKARNGI